jgi:hypothetical protein
MFSEWSSTPARITCVNEALLFGDKNSVEAKAWLDKHYSDSVPAKSTVEKWLAKFKRDERGCYRRKHQKSQQNNFE